MAQKTQELAELKGQNSKLVEQLGEAELQIENGKQLQAHVTRAETQMREHVEQLIQELSAAKTDAAKTAH